MIIIHIDKQGQNGTMIFNILDSTTELWMTKYIIGEIFSSGGASLCKNHSDQTVHYRTTDIPQPIFTLPALQSMSFPLKQVLKQLLFRQLQELP